MLRLPRRGIVFGGLLAFSGLVGLGACASFTSAGGGDADAGEGGTSGSSGTSVQNDAEARDGGADAPPSSTDDLPPSCPRPAFAGTCVPGACSRILLHEPTGPEYPFGITTDSTSVYWLAQVPDEPADAGSVATAYNGKARTRVMRTDKVLGGAPAVVLAEAARPAVSIALDGPYVYFATDTSAAGKTQAELRRVRRDCAGNCDSALVVALAYARVVRILRPVAGVLVLQIANGPVLRVDVTGTVPLSVAALTEVAATGEYPAVIVTPDAGLAGNLLKPDLKPFAISGGAAPPPPTTLPAATGDPGTGLMATDCANAYALRATGLWRGNVDGTGFAHWVDKPFPQPYDLAADARYVYVVGANDVGGVAAYDQVSRASFSIQGGNVWYVAVDAEGVYWGDHKTGQSGKIWMMKKN